MSIKAAADYLYNLALNAVKKIYMVLFHNF